ncbi:MAG: hypothetical protein ABI210_07855, partial [Abditibacteriaceae bacterium]
DSHVVNGTFEGDLKEHDFKKAPNYSEFVCAVNMGIDTQYSSFENIKVVDVTGYGTNTGIGGNGRGDYTTVVLDAGTFTPGDINEKGEPFPSEVRTSTEKPVDISAFLKAHGFFQLGLYLGYQSNPVDNWVYKASFYDADEKFIESIEGYVYRRMYPPASAKFVRFTLLSKMTPGGLSLFDFRPPYNCAYINVHHENIRCVGMCPSGFNNLLAEGNTFENCGWELARCAFDAEDGWDLMQDLTFRNNIFGKNQATEFTSAAGHNFVMEGNTMGANMWDRTNSAVFRNNKIKNASFLFGNPVRSGYHRISHNTFEKGVSLGSAVEKPLRAYIIRDNVISGTAQSDSTASGPHFYKDKIGDSILVGTAVECELTAIKSFYGGFNILKSTLEDSTFQISSGTSYIADSTIKNVVISGSGGPGAVFTNNTIIESTFAAGQDWNPNHSWTFIDNKIQTSLPQLVQIGNSFKQVTLRGNTVDSTNPNFSAVMLANPTNANLKEIEVTVGGNTFNAKGGTVLNIAGLPDAACTLTVYLFGNTYNGIDEISKIAIGAPNVKIVRAEPPQAKLAA